MRPVADFLNPIGVWGLVARAELEPLPAVGGATRRPRARWRIGCRVRAVGGVAARGCRSVTRPARSARVTARRATQRRQEVKMVPGIFTGAGHTGQMRIPGVEPFELSWLFEVIFFWCIYSNFNWICVTDLPYSKEIFATQRFIVLFLIKVRCVVKYFYLYFT